MPPKSKAVTMAAVATPAPGPQGDNDNDATQAPKAASAPALEPQGGDGNGATSRWRQQCHPWVLKVMSAMTPPKPQGGSDNSSNGPSPQGLKVMTIQQR